MTLRVKTLLAGGLTLIVLTCLMYLVAARLLLGGFAAVERGETIENVRHAVHALDTTSIRLSEGVSAWSQWNESYEFIRTGDPAVRQRYITKNLNDEMLASNKADLLIYLRMGGQVVYGTGYDRQAGKKEVLPPDLLPQLRAGSPFLRTTKAGMRGIVLLRQGPVLLASRPILTDVGTGPVRGVLVWGIYLEEGELKKLSQAVRLPISLRRLDTMGLPADDLPSNGTPSNSGVSTPGAVVIRPLNAQRVAGYTMVKDAYGKPALLLRVETDRNIYRQGQNSLRYLLSATLLIGLVFGGLTLWVLERWVLARLSLLNNEVEQISGSGDVSRRVPVPGSDELSQLSASVNRLLEAVEHAQKELRVEIKVRQDAEASLLRSHDELEQRVAERTAELAAANESLKISRDAAEASRIEADTANRAKSEFLSRMSHELRTPLNAILGFGQILDRDNLTPAQKEGIKHILNGGRHLLGLINEVLDITRVEAGYADLAIEPTSLHEVVEEAGAMVQPLAQQRSITFKVKGGSPAASYVQADRQRLRQVLINLLSNGIKYNYEGGRLEVSWESLPDGRTRIAVCDTGHGIAPEEIGRLFTPFERLSAANTEIEGSGLGLVLSKRLVEAMNGTIEVESTPGQGTVFTVVLLQADNGQPTPPVATPADDAGEGSVQKGMTTGAAVEKEWTSTILCIEDNVANLRLIEVLLDDRPDIRLLAAMQGSVGLDLALQHRPDLILLDLNLPDIHGSEVLTRLQQSPNTAGIPVIIVSADATPRQIERLLAAGARAYLTKPFDVARLLEALEDNLVARG